MLKQYGSYSYGRDSSIRAREYCLGVGSYWNISLVLEEMRVATWFVAAAPQRLREPYLCEGCRVVMEEVDQQIQAEITRRQRRGDKPGEINPRNMLRWICNFADPKQPRRYRERMAGFAQPYRDFCAATMRDTERRQALVDTIAGAREERGNAHMTPLVGNTRQFCVERLGLCPRARYREPRGACDACRKLMVDLDDMLSRTPPANMTVELAAEHVEYQCETLPYRFVGTRKPTNVLESTCQELTAASDDQVLAAAVRPPRERRSALLRLCEEGPHCEAVKGKRHEKKKKEEKKKKKRKRKKRKITSRVKAKANAGGRRKKKKKKKQESDEL